MPTSHRAGSENASASSSRRARRSRRSRRQLARRGTLVGLWFFGLAAFAGVPIAVTHFVESHLNENTVAPTTDTEEEQATSTGTRAAERETAGSRSVPQQPIGSSPAAGGISPAAPPASDLFAEPGLEESERAPDQTESSRDTDPRADTPAPTNKPAGGTGRRLQSNPSMPDQLAYRSRSPSAGAVGRSSGSGHGRPRLTPRSVGPAGSVGSSLAGGGTGNSSRTLASSGDEPSHDFATAAPVMEPSAQAQTSVPKDAQASNGHGTADPAASTAGGSALASVDPAGASDRPATRDEGNLPVDGYSPASIAEPDGGTDGAADDGQPQPLLVTDGMVLKGNGPIPVPVVVADAGSVNPGNSPGVLVVDNDFVLDGGTLAIEIYGTGAGEFDQLDIRGEAIFLSGGLHFIFDSLAALLPGDTVTFLLAEEGITGFERLRITSEGLAKDLSFAVQLTGNSLVLWIDELAGLESTLSSTPLPLAQVGLPAPAGLVLAGLALAWLSTGGARRRAPDQPSAPASKRDAENA